MLPVAPIELAEFLLSASQADLQAFDLAEPAFALGLSDAGNEVAADLLQPAALGRVRPEERTSHTSVRYPMLRLDIVQVSRLLQIEANTRERLDEARRMQWLGEVAALEEGLRRIAGKKQQADRLAVQAGPDAHGLS